MADALVITDTSYAGEAASYFITRPVIGMDTVQKGCVHVQDGIKKKYTIPRIEVTNIIQKRQPTPISQGNINVDGRTLIPLDLMLYLEFNPRDYEAHWQAVNLNPKLLDRDLPPTAEEFTMLQTMKRLNEFFEFATWRSRLIFDPSNPSHATAESKGQAPGDNQYMYFDGLLTKLLNDPATLKVSAPKVLISGPTAGANENIGEAIARAFKLIPQPLYYKYDTLKILVSYATQQIYEEFLIAQPNGVHHDIVDSGINRYHGYNLIPLAGIPDNTIVIAVASTGIESNLWVGLNSKDDMDGLQLARLQNNSELYFIKGLFKMDTQIGFPDLVVLYTNITA